MPDSRIGPWSAGGVIGWSTGVATIGGAFAGFIASQTKGSPWHQPVFDLLAAIAAVAFLLLVVGGAVALATWVSPAFRRPARLITSRWQVTTDGVQARAPALAMEIALPGTTHMKQPGDRPPWVRLAAQISCGQVGDDPDWPAIRAAFTAFLHGPAVADLLADLTHVGQDAACRRHLFTWPLWSSGRVARPRRYQARATAEAADQLFGAGVRRWCSALVFGAGVRRRWPVAAHSSRVKAAGAGCSVEDPPGLLPPGAPSRNRTC